MTTIDSTPQFVTFSLDPDIEERNIRRTLSSCRARAEALSIESIDRLEGYEMVIWAATRVEMILQGLSSNDLRNISRFKALEQEAQVVGNTFKERLEIRLRQQETADLVSIATGQTEHVPLIVRKLTEEQVDDIRQTFAREWRTKGTVKTITELATKYNVHYRTIARKVHPKEKDTSEPIHQINLLQSPKSWRDKPRRRVTFKVADVMRDIAVKLESDMSRTDVITELAHRFGVSRDAVRHILNGKTYTNPQMSARKLTETNVRDIRRYLADMESRLKRGLIKSDFHEIAEMYGVTSDNIYNIYYRLTWKDID